MESIQSLIMSCKPPPQHPWPPKSASSEATAANPRTASWHLWTITSHCLSESESQSEPLDDACVPFQKIKCPITQTITHGARPNKHPRIHVFRESWFVAPRKVQLIQQLCCNSSGNVLYQTPRIIRQTRKNGPQSCPHFFVLQQIFAASVAKR